MDTDIKYLNMNYQLEVKHSVEEFDQFNMPKETSKEAQSFVCSKEETFHRIAKYYVHT